MLNFGNKEFRNLQEQVLKNAQDIETLKGRESLQIVIVEELPEEGNPNYIYLVPNNDEEESNVYDEYIWLADEETYEKIGGVSIDMTNYVTLDSAQTISGAKAFTTDTNIGDNTMSESPKLGFISTDVTNQGNWFLFVNQNQNNFNICQLNNNQYAGLKVSRSVIVPTHNNYISLGNNSYRWKNLLLSGEIDFANNAKIIKDSSDRINIQFGGTSIIKVGSTSSYVKASWVPEDNNTHDLGSSSYAWKDAYIAGNISDGVNTFSVANISTRVTSTSQTGTFDSNGESTILDGVSMSEGLYIFTYGNCECVVRLTATMIQSSDVTPIRVACPMIVSGSPSLGWLHIAKSGSNLTISVKDSNDHVDSGFAWTLTKTNLL